MIKIQTKRKYLIFERADIKLEVKIEKKERRIKKSKLTRTLLAGRSQYATFNGSIESDIWLSRDITQRHVGASHTLAYALRKNHF